MNRALSVFRFHFILKGHFIGIPALVLSSAFILSLGIAFVVHLNADEALSAADPMYSGAGQSVLWCLLGISAAVAYSGSAHALGLSYSRRSYMLGMLMALGVVSLGVGAVVALLAWIEEATSGFGIHHYMMALPYLTQQGGAAAVGLLAAAAAMLLMLIGAFFALVYKRFGMARMWFLLIGVMLLVVVLFGLSVIFDWGPAMLNWLLQQTGLTWAGWAALAAAVLAGLTWLVVRRMPANA
ncbi:hypothetical protein [Nesterenkonia flava]|uniref:DUF998 domain-containing protein n=1 Tax=Nesterenkonia flava TaxID=469799 RepID=A0ABU1FWB7_9MICC|nr:hypothetical protein [Nesterenkonia flava]MDR5712966.1 hypothetical protein [Nesterenkonia flava]